MTYWYTVGVNPYPWTTEQLEQICYLRRDLKRTYTQIVEELGLDIGSNTVRKKCKELLGKGAYIAGSQYLAAFIEIGSAPLVIGHIAKGGNFAGQQPGQFYG